MEKNYRAELTGVFGDPVDGNPTGVMEEAAYRECGLNYRYLTLRVKKGDLAAALSGARAVGMKGFNLTMPHKIDVIPYLDRLTPAAALIGALTRGRPGTARVVLASTAGLGVLYLVGLPYLYLIQNAYLGRGLSWPAVVWAGMLVYLPGDALKIAALAVVCRPLRRALGRGAAPAA